MKQKPAQDDFDAVAITPHWIIRNGNWLFLFLLLLLTGISWFIQIPVSTSVKLTNSDHIKPLMIPLDEINRQALQLKKNTRIYIRPENIISAEIIATVNSIEKSTDSLYWMNIVLKKPSDLSLLQNTASISIIQKQRLLHLIINKLHL